MKAILKAYWPTVRKYRWSFASTVIFSTLIVFARSAYPFLLRDMMDKLTGNAGKDVWQTFCLIAGLYAVSTIVNIGFDRAKTALDTKSFRDLDQRSFKAVQAQSMRFFENSYAGSLVSCAKRFCNSFENLADAVTYQLVRSVVMVAITFCVFAWERPLFALAFGVWIVMFCSISYWFAKIRIQCTIEASEKDSRVSGNFADSVANHTAVMSFGREHEEQKRFNDATEDCYQCRKKAYRFRKSFTRIQTVISGIFELLVIFLLIQGLRNGTIGVGDFIFFQTYILLLVAQTDSIGGTFHTVFRCLAEAKEMADIFALQPEVRDAAGARALNVERGDIEFYAVNFSYGNRNKPQKLAVNNFSLSVKAGQTIAIVGLSGAGKTTIAKLLMRCYDLYSGYIRIDGQDIASVTQLSLHQQIAVVPQEPCLFHRSIRDNIAIGDPNANDEEIILAAKHARAWDFISQLPQGLDTVVGERGVKLSGGERQRIAMARAILADSKILILDEATSSLDSQTEHDIQDATSDLLKGRTCIVIAHRLSTIQHANRIVAMENGSIIETGTHKELLHKEGVYANLWSHQFVSRTI